MSVHLVKEQVFEFLSTKNPEVIAIKGRWGVGKTFAWNAFIQDYKNDIAVKSYSYVSLFGSNSIQDIRRSVFENTIDTGIIGESDDLAALKKNYKSVGKVIGRKSGNALKELAKPIAGVALKGMGSSIDKAYESFAFATLNETLICFDDIERHSKGVSLRDFLGLVSSLKEQKKCKVVILLNEDSHDLEEYLIYKEKVIDKQLHFEPSAKQCFEIAIEENREHYQHIRDVCLRLDIRNIRVLKKIDSHINTALRDTSVYDEEIARSIVQSLILFCWCHYCHSSDTKNIPNLNFVKSLIKDSDFEGNAFFDELIDIQETTVKTEKDQRKKTWNDILGSYGFYPSNDFNEVLVRSVEQGYINTELLKQLCAVQQQHIDMKKEEEVYSSGWNVFHGSFDDNEKEVIEKMEAGLRNAIKQLSISQYSSAINLIRDLGREELADELTKLYIDTHKDTPEKLNPSDFDTNPFGIKDKIFGDTLQSFYDSQKQDDSPNSILERRSNQNSYNQSEVRILEKLSADELKTLFKSFNGDELTRKIRACLMLAGSSETLMANAQQALEEIGNESTLNKHRLGKFNIR
ncbi:P-loop NTPase fold protein [Vibrio splendidus]